MQAEALQCITMLLNPHMHLQPVFVAIHRSEHPPVIRDGRYIAPSAPGYSITMKPEVFERYTWPSGDVWKKEIPLRAEKAAAAAVGAAVGPMLRDW